MEITNLDQAVAIGHQLIEEERFIELLDLISKVFPVAPDHPRILNLSVYANWNAGDRELALMHQEKMLNAEPDNKYLNERQIHFAQEVGDLAKVVKACRFADQNCGLDEGMFNAWGLAESELENHEGSLAVFQRSINEFPDYLQAYRNMSVPLIDLGRGEEAVAAFSKSLSPWESNEPEHDTEKIIQRYRKLAKGYDSNTLHQHWGQQMKEFSTKYLSLSRGDRVLDLGCGTGAVGKAISEVGDFLITGIDLSPDMLEVAANTNVYETLIQGDLVQSMNKETCPFNAIFSSVALYHIADLEPIVRQCLRLLTPGGFFFFSTDPALDDFSIARNGEGEYAHSRRYLKSVAMSGAFSSVDIQIMPHRRYPGFWCAFGK